MMQFLRKHQRVLFIIITAVTIASFLFFGTFSGNRGEDFVPDKEVGKAVDGSSIMQRDVLAMTRFLSLANPEVIQKDLIGTGLASILVEKYFESIGPEFQTRLDQLKRYKPYVHPQAPALSAEEVWKRFIPQMNQILEALKMSSASPQTFVLYCNLYLNQTAFPPQLLKRILSYQLQEQGWIQPDHLMTEQRLSILGYQSVDQWFGERFMNVVSQFLINSAVIAEEKGYKISTQEARADLLQTAMSTLKGYAPQSNVSYQDASDFFHQQLQVCGLDELTAVKVWKRVMLFRRLFEDVGHSVLVDPLSYEQFAEYSGERALIELYQLPEYFRFKDFRSLLRFQLYLDAVAPKSRSALKSIPQQFLSSAELEGKTPELVYSRFELEFSRVTQEEIAQKVTLKETWNYETSDLGWAFLTQEFPALRRKAASSGEERFQVLEGVEPTLRTKIDQAARTQILAAHPEWIEENFQKTTPQKVSVALRSGGATPPFDDVTEPTALLSHLYSGNEGDTLPLYTSPRGALYRIKLLQKAARKEIMTFKEAVREGVLDALLDRQLEEAYDTVKKKDPQIFQLANGAWRPLQEVKDLVGAKLYSDVLKPDFAEACAHRFAAFMQEAKKSIQTRGEGSSFTHQTGDPLKDQFLLTKNQREVKRSDPLTLSKEELFTQTAGYWSSVSTPSNGDLAFFRLIELQKSRENVADKVEEGQKILGVDAKRLLTRQILDRMAAYE